MTAVLIQAVICGIVSALVASAKGRKGGFFWGFFLSILGIIIVLFLPNENN